jgi:D-aspartate ligase
MIEEIGLEGIWEYEFLVGKDGKMYFMEINFRNTVIGWATTVAGMPNITLWCKSMQEGHIADNCYKNIPEGFTTMAECFDYDARVKAGLLSHKEWMKQYKSVDAKLYKGRKDFRPFFSFMWYKLTRMKLDH